jgi:GxxExxY protein
MRITRMDANDSSRDDNFVEQQLSYRVVNAFFEVYNSLGYGLLESLYVAALVIALEERGLKIEREVSVPVYFRGHLIGNQRLDLVVEGRIVIEVKSTELLSKAGFRQLRSYLAASRRRLGLILHFGPTPQFHRILNANM